MPSRAGATQGERRQAALENGNGIAVDQRERKGVPAARGGTQRRARGHARPRARMEAGRLVRVAERVRSRSSAAPPKRTPSTSRRWRSAIWPSCAPPSSRRWRWRRWPSARRPCPLGIARNGAAGPAGRGSRSVRDDDLPAIQWAPPAHAPAPAPPIVRPPPPRAPTPVVVSGCRPRRGPLACARPARPGLDASPRLPAVALEAPKAAAADAL